MTQRRRDSYTSDPQDRTVTVAAGATAAVTGHLHRAGRSSTLNLRIAGAHLTQSVQTFSNEVPLVAGRDALPAGVRAGASENNYGDARRPGAALRRRHAGADLHHRARPADTVADRPDDGDPGTRHGTCWFPGRRVRPGLAIAADVDPTSAIAEADETDNASPPGAPRPLTVRATPPLAITLVPVRQSGQRSPGRRDGGNRDQYLDLTRRVHPIPGYDATVHGVYTTTTTDPLQSDDANGAWNTILSEVLALRSRRTASGTTTAWSGGLQQRARRDGLHRTSRPRSATTIRPTAHGSPRTSWVTPGGAVTRRAATPGTDQNFPYPDGNIGRIRLRRERRRS